MLWFVEGSATNPFATLFLFHSGYVELELNQYAEAVATFEESLKIQRKLLSLENPLVISTMDNLGYAYTMSRLYTKAHEVNQKPRETEYGDWTKLTRWLCCSITIGVQRAHVGTRKDGPKR
jgi:tetratricopeptide (TPR) repeat protein